MKIKHEKKIRFAFYVSGAASRLIKLLETHSAVIKDTILVVNDNAPNVRLGRLLLKNRFQYVEIDYKKRDLILRDKNIYISNLLFEKFKAFDIDYCFCFGGRILKGELVRAYKNKIINFHPSVLPSFPGLKAIDQALHNRSYLLGNTAHFIDEGIDTGPVIMQCILNYKNYLTYESVLSLQIPMVEQIYRWIIDKRLIMNGDEVTIRDADYASTIFYPKLEIK